MEMHDMIAKELLKIGAVKINTDDYFTWTSGIRSPIYCDNRLTMSYPHVRRQIAAAFSRMIADMDACPDVIAGCATAGIPHAAWLAEQRDLPMVYVRSKPKEHGLENRIEGHIEKGDRVLVVEDLISTGGSAIEAAEALRQQGADVLGVAAIFTYGMQKASEQFAEADLRFRTLTDFAVIVRLLTDEGKLTEREQHELNQWRAHL